MVARGHSAALLFVVQRGDCTAFAPCHAKDPAYFDLVARAAEQGVQVLAVVCDLDEAAHEVVFRGSIPVMLEYVSAGEGSLAAAGAPTAAGAAAETAEAKVDAAEGGAAL